jgi:hypothetical protein
MNLPNPDINLVKTSGIDRPIMTCYLAGRICGEHIDKCLAWRKQIVEHYKNYKGQGAYPIAFLDALNSKEADSIDKLGLTSSIPPNMIWDKDILSIKTADVIVANMDDFFEEDISEELRFKKENTIDEIQEYYGGSIDFQKAFFKLQEKIKNRRENLGTICEVMLGLYLGKPVILIVPERRKEIFEKHPFMRRTSIIVTSVDQLLKEKWLQTLYKAQAGAIY